MCSRNVLVHILLANPWLVTSSTMGIVPKRGGAAVITYANDLTPDEYLHLRGTTDWAKLSRRQAERGLENATYAVVARDGDRAVGMARVLFDFGYTAYIHDVIVHPDYQRKGIGTALVKNILRWLDDNSRPDEFMQYVLVAGKGKEQFYEKFGFVSRPTNELGAGMTLRPNGDG